MSLKQNILLNLKNVIGWRTERQIIVFSIDDYGNVRLDSKEARDKMFLTGLKPLNRFDYFDSLENEDDLISLYETLSSVIDKNKRHAVFTAFALVANINFEKIRESRYNEYYYEPLPETFSKLKGYQNVWNLWKEGIEKQLLVPQFHGREHVNLKFFTEAIKQRNTEVITALENRSCSCISGTGYPTISYTAAFDFFEYKENEDLKLIIKDGLKLFEKVFGFKALHFNACGSQGYNKVIEPTLAQSGIKYIDTDRIKKEHQGNGAYKRIFHYTGKKNSLGQTYLVRNCVFEPTEIRGFDWVNFCLKQISTAFRWKQPAVISSHRVNFSGNIDPSNRKMGLESLKKLLAEIVKRWPDSEFMTSGEVMDLISSSRDVNNLP